MYESFFMLRNRPFLAAPRVDRYFPARSIDGARHTLARAAERGEGAAVVVGASGIGKSLLCQKLADDLASRMNVVMLACGHIASRRELLQAIHFELGLAFRGLDEGELRLSLAEHLGDKKGSGRPIALIVDEAHTLSPKALDELRVLTNMVRDGLPRVRLVLSGSAALEERLANPKLGSLQQRIAARCYIEAFDRRETESYVRRQIEIVGGAAERIFCDSAYDAIHQATDGIPRLLNQLCDHALMLAFASDERRLDATGIEEAWANLQQLPGPWHDARRRSTESENVVEFGDFADQRANVAQSVDHDLGFELAGAGPGGLESFEQSLGAFDDDFTPAGKIGPVDESRHELADDPFEEVFANEEVVFDRYASFDASVLALRARVRSNEGRALAAALKPFLDAAAEPRLRVTDPIAIDESIVIEPESVDWSSASVVAGGDTIASGFDSLVTSVDSLEEPPSQARRWHPSSSMNSASQDAQKSDELTDDRDIMLIEDDVRLNVSEATQRPAAKRLDYRQLFAKLRRGG